MVYHRLKSIFGALKVRYEVETVDALSREQVLLSILYRLYMSLKDRYIWDNQIF